MNFQGAFHSSYHLFFRQYRPDSNPLHYVDLSKQTSRIYIEDHVNSILEVIPRIFTITTNTMSYHFNIEMLKDTCLSIKEVLQVNPDLRTFHIDIKEKKNVMQKFEQLFLGKEVIFDESEISTTRKITSALKLYQCPSFMKPESLKNPNESNMYQFDYSEKNPFIIPVSINKPSVINFLSSIQLNQFTIITKNKSYICNSITSLLSQVIKDRIKKDPFINEFYYDFDDEFCEFDDISNFLTFKPVQITPKNMNALKKMAEDLYITCIINQIDEFIDQYESSIQTINDKQILIDSINELFGWLYRINELKPENVKESILKSIWCKSEENIQELVACLLQVIYSDFIYHSNICELVILLYNSADTTNNLDILMPFLVKKLMFLFSQNLLNCAFIYKLYKKGFILKEELFEKLHVKPELITKDWQYSYRSSSSNAYFSFLNKPKPSISYFSNMILWFFPELLELKRTTIDIIKNIVTDDQFKFIKSYYPDHLELFNQMRKSGEPQDAILKSLIHDDVYTLQLIIANGDININKNVIFYNIFQPFALFDCTTYLNHAAAYGSVKCFKYLLMNHATIDHSTFKFAVFGENFEIIRIVAQNDSKITPQNVGTRNGILTHSNTPVMLIAPAIIKHNNDLLDWVIEERSQGGNNNTNNLLSQLISISANNGNAHSFIECINRGLDMSTLMQNNAMQIISDLCERGFYHLLQLAFHFVPNLFNKNESDIKAPMPKYSSEIKKIDLCESSVFFGNLSIFKLMIGMIKDDLQKNLEKALMKAIEMDYFGIIKYICETEKYESTRQIAYLNRDTHFSIDSFLIKSIELKRYEIFNYLFDKFDPKDLQPVLLASCKIGNLDIVKKITYFILLKNPDKDFSPAFIEASSNEYDEICQYFIDKKINLDISYLSKYANRILQGKSKTFFALVEIVDSSKKEAFLIKFFEMAILKRKYSIVDYLMKENIYDQNALINAISTHDVEMVNLILKYNNRPSFINQIFENGTALNIAVKSNDLKIVQILLSLPGIDPNLYDHYNNTPLISAILNVNMNMINLILDFYGDQIQEQKWQLDEALKKILKIISSKKKKVQNTNFAFNQLNNKQDDESDSYLIHNSDESQITNVLNMISQIKNVDLNCRVDAYTLLSYACETNEINLVKNLLCNDNINVNLYAPTDGKTPLMIAIENNNQDIAELLINSPHTNINHNNYYKQTALTIAASSGFEKIVSLLINDYKFDPEESNINYAFYLSNDKIAKLLLPVKGLNVNNCMVPRIANKSILYSKESKLILAVNSGNEKLIDLIISHPSFDLNKSQSMTAVFAAISNDQISIFKKLLNLFDNDLYFSDKSLLVSAAECGSNSIISEILNHESFNSAKSDIVQAFISSIASDTKGNNNDNYFNAMEQIYNYDKKHENWINLNELVYFKESNKNQRKSFFTIIPVDKYNSFRFAEFLLTNGADPNCPDQSGIYPFQQAIKSQSIDFVQTLIDSGKIDFSVRLKEQKNQTYLHVAAQLNNPLILRLLLDNNIININSTDDDGNTPLMVAAAARLIENIKELFKQDNLDFLHVNNKGQNALKLIDSRFNRNHKYDISQEPGTKTEYLQELISRCMK